MINPQEKIGDKSAKTPTDGDSGGERTGIDANLIAITLRLQNKTEK